LLLCDIPLLVLSPLAAYTLRFEGFGWTVADTRTAIWYVGIALLAKLSVFVVMGLYGRLWQYASMPDLWRILQANAIAMVACGLVGIFALPLSGFVELRVPISVLILDAFFTLSAVAISRLAMRAGRSWALHRSSSNGKRTLIVGAGSAGEMILRELRTNPQLELTAVGFADDKPEKRESRLMGVPILGTLDEIPEIVRENEIAEIVIALPTAPGRIVHKIMRAASQVKVPARTIPALFDIVSGRVGVSSLRRVEIEDLLRREPVRTDMDAIGGGLTGKTVLVTGAGGSIGSELSRQIAALNPRELLLLGHAENEIFDISGEIAKKHPGVKLCPIIADIRNEHRVNSVFEKHGPEVVFHAAAHKHVPLMEGNIAEAVTNNVMGSENLVNAAVTFGTQRFLLISTDKAVQPTSVMGATKHAAELIVQQAARKCGRHFVSVRFGNVLASRGSVVPTFLDQIEQGGPVTITHPQMQRFFMTIPEAVQLVLQAGTLGTGGEVFVLDMGEPVLILDLARDLIELSGLEVGKDIEIRYTGMRPGERFEEALFAHCEDVERTTHPSVLCAAGNGHVPQDFDNRVALLTHAAQACVADDKILTLLKSVVPEFDRERMWTTAKRNAGIELNAEKTASTADCQRPAAVLAESAERTDQHLTVERRSPVLDRRASNDRRESGDSDLRTDPLRIERRECGDRRSGLERRTVSVPIVSAPALNKNETRHRKPSIPSPIGVPMFARLQQGGH